MSLKLYFDEAEHKYTDEYKRQYVSVTTFIGDYYEKFDTKAMAFNCYRAGLNGNPKYKGKSIKQIENEWEAAKIKGCTTGTIKHGYLEDIIKTASNFYKKAGNLVGNKRLYTITDVIDNPGFGEIKIDYFISKGFDIKYPDIFNTIVYLASIGYRFYAEVGVFNADFLISGCIDLFAIKDKEFIIIDWKTNKAPLRFEAGYHEKDREGLLTGQYILTGKTMSYPIAHLAASDGIKYTIQLSSYARLAEYAGLTCKALILYHIITNQITSEETVMFHPITYLKTDVDLLFMDRQAKIPKTVQTQILNIYQ